MTKHLLCLLAAVTLVCGVVNARVTAVNYVLNEGFESGIPADWTQVSVVGDAAWSTESLAGGALANPTGVAEGSARAYLRNSGSTSRGYVTRLVSPQMDLSSGGQPLLVFSHAQAARQGLFDTLAVYYRPSSTAAWTLLKKYESSIAVWQQDTVLLAGASASAQLAFEIAEGDGLGVVLDDIRVYYASQCMDASFIRIAPDATSAKLEWTGDWGGVDFELAVFPQYVDIQSLTDFSTALYHNTTLTGFEQVVTGLQPQTGYYAYLRSTCDDNESGYTAWTSASFKTRGQITALPYKEDFNSLSGNITFPVGWTRGHYAGMADETPFVYAGTSSGTKGYYSVDTTSFMLFSGAASYTAPSYLSGNQYAYAALPMMAAAPVNSLQVDFWGTAYNTVARTSNNYYDNLLVVGVMTNPDEVQTFVPVDTVTIESAFQHKHFVVNLSSYTGQGKYITLMALTRNGSNLFAVDRVKVETVGVPVPTHLALKAITPDEMTLSVDREGADSWELYVAESYVRDTLPAAVVLQQTGLTAQSVQVALPDSLEGRTVVIYARGVKNGQAGATCFPLTVRIPTRLEAFPYEENFNTAQTALLRTLNNELHTKSTSQYTTAFYFPLHDLSYCYPIRSTANPKYDNTARLQLQGIGTWVTLGYIDTLTTKEVSFRLSSGSTTAAYSRVALGVMTNPYDSTSFEQLAVYEGPVKSYVKCMYDFDQYTGQGHYIALKNLAPPTATTSNCGANTAIDNIQVTAIPSCREVTDVNEQVGVTTAQLSWDANTMSKWQVVVSTSEAMADTVSQQVVTSPQVTLSGLQSNSNYYYKVNTICGQDTIQMESPHSILTYIGIPYSEPFNGSTWPSGWTLSRGLAADIFSGTASFTASNVNYSWNLKTTAPAPMEAYTPMVKVTGKTTKEWMISPTIRLETQGGARLTFDVVATSDSYKGDGAWGNDDRFLVIVSEDNGQTWSAANATEWANHSLAQYDIDVIGSEVQSMTIDLTAYKNKNVRIAFYAESTLTGGYEDNALYVDNIQVLEYDPNCAGLTQVKAVSKHDGEIEISWTAAGTQSVYAVVSENADFSNPIYAQMTSANPVVVSGLQPQTDYYVGLRQSCDTTAELRQVKVKTLCAAKPISTYGTETFDDITVLDCWHLGMTEEVTSDMYPEAKTLTNKLPEVASTATFGSFLKVSKQQNTETAKYGDGQYAIMPELSFNGDSITHYQVSFDAALLTKDTMNAGKLDVGVVTDPTDLATYAPVKRVQLGFAADSTELYSYTVSFADYTGDYNEDYGYFIAFLLHAGDSANQVLIDNIRFTPLEACEQIRDVEITNVTPSHAKVKWDGEADTYDIIVTPDRVADPATNPDAVYTAMAQAVDSVELNDLTAGSNYFVYLRSHCGAAQSSWSTPFRFKTKLGVPFTEPFTKSSFENDWTIMEGWLDSVLVDSAKLAVPETQHWYTAELSGFTGLKGTAVRLAQYSSKRKEWLISPLLDCSDIVPGTSLQLSFGAAIGAYQYFSNITTPMSGNTSTTNQRLVVVFSTDGGQTWQDGTKVEISNRQGAQFSYSSMNGNGTTYRVNADFLAGAENVLIAFYGESTNESPQNYLYLDEISLQKVNANCDAPTGITVGTTTFNSASVTFSSADPSAQTYQYACVKSGAALRNSTPVVTVNGQSTVITGLEASTNYDIYVRQVCGANGQSAWFGPVSFKTQLGVRFSDAVQTLDNWTPYGGKASSAFGGVAPTPTNNNYSGWIVGSNYAVSGMATGHAVCKLYNNTTDYWLISKPIDMSNMTGKFLQLSFDYGLTSDNGSFDGSMEDLYVIVSTDGGQSWPEENSFKIGRDGDANNLQAVNQTYRYNVSLSRFAGQTIKLAFVGSMNTANPGYNYDYHHLTNVLIDTVDAEPFDGVTRIRVANVQPHGATVSFQSRSTVVDHYVYVIVPHGYDHLTATEQVSTSATVDVSDLEPETDYDVYAYAVSQQNDSSAWVGPCSFRTACLADGDDYYDFENNIVEYTTKYGLSFGMPECWSHLNAVSLMSGYSTVRTDTAFVVMGESQTDVYHRTGSSALLLSSSGESFATFAIMPAVEGLDSLQLNFWARPGYETIIEGTASLLGGGEDYARTLSVGTMTNREDSTTYTELYSISLDIISAAPETDASLFWREYSVNLAGATGPYVAFRSTGFNFFTIDDISFQKADDCAPLVGSPIATPAETSAQINWPTAGDSIEYEVLVASVGEAMDLSKAVRVTTNSYTAQNLTAATDYEVSVRVVCDSAHQSIWRQSQFTTQSQTPVYTCSSVKNLLPDSVSEYYAHLTYALDDEPQTVVLQLSTDLSFNTIVRSDTVIAGNVFEYYNLRPSTTYYVRAKHVCGVNDESEYVQAYIRTPELQPVVENWTDSICQGYDYTGHGFNVAAANLQLGMNKLDRYDAATNIRTEVTLYVGESKTTDLYATLCEGETYTENGFNFTATKSMGLTQRQFLQTQAGCDSMIVLHVTLVEKAYTNVKDSVLKGDVYTWHGREILSAGEYTDTLRSAAGCDSIVTLTLTYRTTSALGQLTLQSMSALPNPVQAGQQFRLKGGFAAGAVVLRMYSLTGALMEEQKLVASGSELPVTAPLVPGAYNVTLQTSDRRLYRTKLLVR